MQLTVQVMEDWQRCLVFHRLGHKTMKFNFLSIETTNRGKGGCQSHFGDGEHKPQRAVDGKLPEVWSARAEVERDSAKTLQELFGDMLKVVPKKPVEIQHKALGKV